MLEDFIAKIRSSRSVRRFDESERIGADGMRNLAEAARQTPSAGNLQPLRYVLVSSASACERVFPWLGWAAYLKNWKGPEPGERPTGYFIICSEKDAAGMPQVDAGIVAQTIMLGASAAGFGACILGSVNREKLGEALDLPAGMDILFVVALGRPAEEVRLEELPKDGDVRYWRDAQGVHHVPKRSYGDVVVGEFYDEQEKENTG